MKKRKTEIASHFEDFAAKIGQRRPEAEMHKM
jgi:hypothetical protein